MICIPFSINQGRFNVLIVLEQDGIDRIKEHDPAEVNLRAMPEPYRSMTLDEVHITFGTADDIRFIMSQEPGGTGLKEVLKRMTRGWKYRPELGDNDGPPQMPTHN